MLSVSPLLQGCSVPSEVTNTAVLKIRLLFRRTVVRPYGDDYDSVIQYLFAYSIYIEVIFLVFINSCIISERHLIIFFKLILYTLCVLNPSFKVFAHFASHTRSLISVLPTVSLVSLRAFLGDAHKVVLYGFPCQS